MNLPSWNRAGLLRESWIFGCLGVLLFTLGMGQQPFTGFDARFAVFAQEMMRHGPTLFPTTYGEPYPDYPATMTWLIWLCSQPFGQVTHLTAVLPTAVASALSLVLTYRLFARTDRHWALLAVCFELLCAMFLAEARSISLDQIVTTITLSCFYLVYGANWNDSRGRLVWLAVLLALGFAFRGPLGIVIPASVVISYYAVMGRWRHLVYFGALAGLVLAACWGLLLLESRHLYGEAFTRDVVRMQVAGRMDSEDDPRRLYYFTSSFGNYALTFPIAVATFCLLMPMLLKRATKDNPLALIECLIGWLLIVLIGLSIPATKKARYILPIVPALAGICAYIFMAQRNRALRVLSVVVEGVFCLLPLLGVVALLVAKHRLVNAGVNSTVVLATTGLLVVLQLLSAIFCKWAQPAHRPLRLAMVAVAVLWSLYVFIGEPLLLRLHDASDFVHRVEAARSHQPGELVFFCVGKDAGAIKYLVNVDRDIRPSFIAKDLQIDQLKRPVYLVLENKDIKQISASHMALSTPAVEGRFDNHAMSALYLPADKASVIP